VASGAAPRDLDPDVVRQRLLDGGALLEPLEPAEAVP
jgi:hypothetical protein